MNVESVPFFDYSRLHLVDYPQYGAALTDVLERSDFIMREDLLTFEDNLGKYLGVNHVVGVGNGTDAIWFCLLAAGIKPGDEVILPSHTYVATADAVKFIGGVPVLVDCQDDHLISPAAIEEAITGNPQLIASNTTSGKLSAFVG